MSRLSSRALAQSAVLLACALCWFCATPALAQGTYNWNTTSGTWNTTDANWSGAGSTWVNGTSSNAVFNNTSGATVTISESISAGDVSFGDASNNRSWTLSSGTLSAAGNLAYQGFGSNSGAYGSNPTLTVNSNIDVAGSILIGRANFVINGGTYTTSRITTNPASADWANFQMFGGSVTATNGIDGTYGTNGSNGTTATFNVLLQGGTLSTTYLRVADREASGAGGGFAAGNNAWLTLNGTVLRALTSTSSFIQTYGGGNNVFIAGSGAYFDSNGFDIGVDRTLANYTGQTGFLVKQGSGTLTLSGVNSYSGSTTVSGGVLQLSGAGTLGGGSAALTMSGGQLDLGGLSSRSVGAVTVSTAYATGDTIRNGTLSATSYSITNASGTAAISATLSGGAGLTKSGAGAAALSATNTYTGVTTFAGGVLNASTITNYGVAGSLGNRTSASDAGGTVGLLFQGGTLQYTGSTAQSTDRAIRLSTTGGGGTIDASGSDPSATLSFTAASSPNFFENPGSRSLTFTGSNTGTNTFAMAIGEAGGTTSVVKSGNGTWLLSGSSSYSGGTTLSAGRLLAGSSTAFGTGGVTVNGGVASLSGFSVANAFTLTSGTLLGTSGTSGAGSIAVGSGVIDPAGGRLNAGAVTLGSTGANPGTTTPFSGNGLLAASSFIVQGNSNNGPGGGPVTISAGTLTTSGNLGVGRWSLTLGGSSTVTVSGTIGGGGISSSPDWGTLTIQDNAVVTATGGVNGNAEAWQLNLNGGTLNTRSIQASDREVSNSTARLVFNGTRIVATASNASFVTVGANASATNSALVGNGGVDIDSNGFDLGIGINLRPDTSSTGGLTKRGAGTLTLTGANTYTGATSVNAGTLAVNGSLGNTAVSVASGATLGGSGSIAGSVNVLGTLSPGNSPGVITLGSLVLGGTSTTLIEITGTSRGTAYDGIDITTSSGLTYGGLLSLDFSSLGLAVPNDTTFDIFSFLGSPSGNFSSVTSTGLYAGTWTSLGSGSFQLVSGAQTLTFSQATGDIIVVPEPTSLALAAIGLAAGMAAYRRRRSPSA